jgi:hypothetical protein
MRVHGAFPVSLSDIVPNWEVVLSSFLAHAGVKPRAFIPHRILRE